MQEGAGTIILVGDYLALLRMPNSDRGVLLSTFGLTVIVDFTVAIGVRVTQCPLCSHGITFKLARLASVSATTRRTEGEKPKPQWALSTSTFKVC